MTQTHFGFETVDEKEKAQRVAGVFSSVAQKYDVMNDLMSMGLHRLWKKFAIDIAAPRPGERVLDVAGGTADLSSAFSRKVGSAGQVWLTDINNAMLRVGRDRLLDEGMLAPVAQCDAEQLPFPDNHFDIVTVAFGLRNMTHKDAGSGRNAPRPAAGRTAAGAGIFQGLETAGKSLRCLFVQAAALAGTTDCR
jgi:demethylmenaquinone methyltransferase/2-methoxy-6-polyprenyl-1,4-benzoquinol methylase